MILLNFAHPLTDSQLDTVRQLTGAEVERVMDIRSQIDPDQPLAPQVTKMLDAAGLSPTQWQSESLLINPPSLNFSTAVMLAELHGRCGYFPPCLRLRPAPDVVPPRFEVAEILHLNAIRESARKRR